MSQLFIEAGPSPWGASGLDVCDQQYAWNRYSGLTPPDRMELEAGSLGHVLQAHHWALVGAKQGGVLVGTGAWGVSRLVWAGQKAVVQGGYFDGMELADPITAARHYAMANATAAPYLNMMLKCYQDFLSKSTDQTFGRIIGVEVPVVGILGWVRGAWGLWTGLPSVLPADLKQDIGACPGWTRATWSDYEAMAEGRPWNSGAPIEVAPLNCPGSPRDGYAIGISRRKDLIGDKSNVISVVDHKHNGHIDAKKAPVVYSQEMGFVAYRPLAHQLWPGRRIQVQLHLIERGNGAKTATPLVPACPERERTLAQNIWDARHRVAAAEADYLAGTRDLSAFQKAPSAVCYHRFGPCDWANFCNQGQAAGERIWQARLDTMSDAD